jgi:hypothetical protein
MKRLTPKRRPSKTTKVARREHPAVARPRSSSAVTHQKQLDQRTRELAEAQKHLAEALEQQTATSEVLQVISTSLNQLQPVLDSIVATAADLCQADFAMIHTLEHGRFRLVAANRVEAKYIKWLAQNPPNADSGSISGRVVAERASILRYTQGCIGATHARSQSIAFARNRADEVIE